MTRIQQSSNTLLAPLFLLLAVITMPCTLFAQDIVPSNAHSKTYSAGWECDLGFRQTGKSCVAVQLPDNSYATNASYGAGWKCNWGFIETGGSCIAVKLPPNAYINTYGDNWKCKRGYLKTNDLCIAVDVPENAYYAEDAYQIGWKCKRLFSKKITSVLPLQFPRMVII